MGRLNIDILYQMFKDGVVYRVTPDAGPHGGPYKIGGKTQDQIAIERQKERREKYAKTERKQQQKKADKEKEKEKLIQAEKESCKKKLDEKQKEIARLKQQRDTMTKLAKFRREKLEQELKNANNAQNVDQIQNKLNAVSMEKEKSDNELQKAKQEARTLEQEMSALNKKLQLQQDVIDQQKTTALDLEKQKQAIRQELESLKRKANEEKRKAELEKTPEGRKELETEADDIQSANDVVSDDLIKMASSWYDSELKGELSNYLTNSGKTKLNALQTSLQQETGLGDINTTIETEDIMPEGKANISNQEEKLKNARAILYALAERAQKNRSETTDKTFQEELQKDWGDEIYKEMVELEEQRTNASEEVEKLTKELEQAKTQGGLKPNVVNELQNELNAVKKKREALEAELTNKKNDLLDENRPELGTGFRGKGVRKDHLQNAIRAINAIFKERTRNQLEEVFLDYEFSNALINEPMDDLHPFVMKPAAPQLHMQKLHMQTSMEKLDLEPAMETVPDDVHVEAVQPMKCGKAMKVEPVACAKHEPPEGKMKRKSHDYTHEPAEADILTEIEALGRGMFGGKKKKKKKTKGKKLIADPQQCDSCGELHDGDHDCELEAFQAMLDGYDSEGQALEKPRCASVGLANRKLNELQ